MSVKLESRPLPHKVGTAGIANAELKRITMQFMENFKSLHAQLKQTQNAVRELQRKET